VREEKKVGVVLFQLGGPDSLEAVRPFLYNLFCDPDILDFPGLGPFAGLLRRPLAWWIARRRAPHVAHHYEEIGGRSPILPLTERQARALEEALDTRLEARCFIAMRYWHPFTAEAAAALNAWGPEEIVLLPLYPQYSFATTGSALNEWRRRWRGAAAGPLVHTVESFPEHPLLLAAFVERIQRSLAHFARPGEVHLLFSAHGLPVSFIERGDPYQRQVEATVRGVMALGAWRNPHSLCYQSKVGRQRWLEPMLEPELERLGRAGVRQVLVIPVAFVSDHIETLHEINIEARVVAEAAGVEQFEMTAALGENAKFIAALAELVVRAVGAREPAPSLRL
jgi:protoporphyrin/coproporphyrin ferrochelatase